MVSGPALLTIILISGILYVALLRESSQKENGMFILALEPTGVVMEVGEFRDFTLNVISTGYQGNITEFDLAYSWTRGELPLEIIADFLPSSDEKFDSGFLQDNGSLTLILRVTLDLLKGKTLKETTDFSLNVRAYGNWKQADQFEVSSSPISVTVRPSCYHPQIRK